MKTIIVVVELDFASNKYALFKKKKKKKKHEIGRAKAQKKKQKKRNVFKNCFLKKIFLLLCKKF